MIEQSKRGGLYPVKVAPKGKPKVYEVWKSVAGEGRGVAEIEVVGAVGEIEVETSQRRAQDPVDGLANGRSVQVDGEPLEMIVPRDASLSGEWLLQN